VKKEDYSLRTARWVVSAIVRLNTKVRDFWTNAYGWAPKSAADLLNRSRLDRQVSLSHCLSIWLDPSITESSSGVSIGDPAQAVLDAQTDGRLILAWANLGSLVEGTMKFFLCVFEHDYSNSPATFGKAQMPLEPDDLQFETLKQFFGKRIWSGTQRERWTRFVDLVQQRRNAIHAYKDREIGTMREFYTAVKNYLVFLAEIEGCVPYPDEPR